MKKILLITAVLIGLGAYVLWATDATYHLRVYADQGRSAGYVVNEGLTSVFDADGNYGISTTNRYQLQRDIIPVPITMASAGEDTTWFTLFTVPTGQTITIEEIRLSAHTELSGSNDSAWASILYHQFQGDTLLVLDTCVAQFAVDADSAAYDDTLLTLTLVDSTFDAGEILVWWQMNLEGAATGGEGANVTILYRRDE